MTGYRLEIYSWGEIFEFEVSFFLDKERWYCRGTCPSIEACFDEAQKFVNDTVSAE